MVVPVRTSGAAKQLRNVKRPRPLKMSPSQLDEVLEQVQGLRFVTFFYRVCWLDPDPEHGSTNLLLLSDTRNWTPWPI
jgi:hypothetical protein